MLRSAVLILSAAAVSHAGLLRINVEERSDVMGGKSLGPAGGYERVRAKAYFAVDPKLPQNRIIRDIDYAPKNGQGIVEFSADLYVLKPRDSAKGNGTVLFEVSNRGGRGTPGRFGYNHATTDSATNESLGDLFLLERGYTLVWLGWQADVPDQAGLLRLYAPVARDGTRPITGLVRSEFIPSQKTARMPLADRNHHAYPALETPGLKLTVRNSDAGERQEIPNTSWNFTSGRTAIEMSAGFEPGRIYEIVYHAQDPVVTGLGPAGIRDLVSFLKYGGNGVTLLGDQTEYIKRAIGFGVSQSGRFLRTFLYFGFNQDERGRKVFDGVWADVAGGGRGSFNHRFAQPSRDGHPFLNTLYPTDLFPFTDAAQTDPETGLTDGLLSKCESLGVVPKIFYTNGSYEYWGRDAALIHITLDGRADVAPAKDTRIYFMAGTQHGPGRLPPVRNSTQYLSNPNDFRPVFRALLEAMQAWLKDGKEPPPSQYPDLSSGELAPLAQLKFPKIPGVEPPAHPMNAWRADYGPEFLSKGIVSIDPPKLGKPFPVLLPQVDSDGNDKGGVRMPEVASPLGTYTGWNLRAASIGAPNELYSMVGSFIPFARVRKERAAGDARPPIEERYSGKAEYLERIDAAAADLIQRGFVLERDRDAIRGRAGQLWDFVQAAR